MAQKKTSLSHHIKALRNETKMLLRYYIAEKRILKFEYFNHIGRTDYVDLLVASKAIENDLIMRISKFDDRTRGVHSFHKAEAMIPDNHVDKKIISEKIREFSKFISGLRDERRHEKLAHLKIGKVDNEFDVRYDLAPAIRMIADIVDLMNGGQVEYLWSDGSMEKYDLRKIVLESKEKLTAPLSGFR
jgi:hypothetical protein